MTGSRPPFSRANSCDYLPSLFSHCTTRALHSHTGPCCQTTCQISCAMDFMPFPYVIRRQFSLVFVSSSLSVASRLLLSGLHEEAKNMSIVVIFVCCFMISFIGRPRKTREHSTSDKKTWQITNCMGQTRNTTSS